MFKIWKEHCPLENGLTQVNLENRMNALSFYESSVDFEFNFVCNS